MLLVIAYVFASFGLAFALGYGKITLPLRSFLEKFSEPPTYHWGRRAIAFGARWLLALLECPACLAFWLGLGSVFTPLVHYFSYDFSPMFLALFLGFGNMGAVLSLGLWTGLIQAE
jgi:hypothetical protein